MTTEPVLQLPPLPPLAVVEAVAEVMSLEAKRLWEPSRESPWEDARRVCYHLLHEASWLSWGNVAVLMGVSSAISAQRAAKNAKPDLVERTWKLLAARLADDEEGTA